MTTHHLSGTGLPYFRNSPVYLRRMTNNVQFTSVSFTDVFVEYDNDPEQQVFGSPLKYFEEHGA